MHKLFLESCLSAVGTSLVVVTSWSGASTSTLCLLFHVELQSLPKQRGRQLYSICSQDDSIRADLLHLIEISGSDLDDISSEIRLEILDRLPRVFIADKVDRDTLLSESTRST